MHNFMRIKLIDANVVELRERENIPHEHARLRLLDEAMAAEWKDLKERVDRLEQENERLKADVAQLERRVYA